MPHIEIEGVRAYQYRPLPPQLEKAVHAKHLKLRYVLGFVMMGLFAVLFILYAATGFNDTSIFGRWSLLYLIVGLAMYFAGASMNAKAAKLLHDRKLMRSGSYEGLLVMPTSYSYQAILSPAVQAAMENDSLVSAKVDTLFAHSMIAFIEWEIKYDQQRSSVKKSKLEIIEMAEKLSDELGIAQPDHFKRLRREL